jgi:hypothetical protein
VGEVGADVDQAGTQFRREPRYQIKKLLVPQGERGSAALLVPLVGRDAALP